MPLDGVLHRLFGVWVIRCDSNTRVVMRVNWGDGSRHRWYSPIVPLVSPQHRLVYTLLIRVNHLLRHGLLHTLSHSLVVEHWWEECYRLVRGRWLRNRIGVGVFVDRRRR